MRNVEATMTVPERSQWGFVSLYERTVTDVLPVIMKSTGPAI